MLFGLGYSSYVNEYQISYFTQILYGSGLLLKILGYQLRCFWVPVEFGVKSLHQLFG